MGQNNKKYLDYAGLEKLVDMHAVVPHPEMTENVTKRALKFAYDEHGHITEVDTLTAADLGLNHALHFRGESTTDPLSTTGATVTTEPIGSFEAGDIVIYKRTKTAGDNGQGNFYDDGDNTTELYYEEYIYTGSAWELLGDASSYALKEIKVAGDGTFITGGGDLSSNRTLSHKTYTEAAAAITAIGRDAGGHVIIGNEITVQSGGGSVHDHTTSITIPKDTYVVGVSPTKTNLSTNSSKAKVLKSLPGEFSNLNTTSITGVSGSTTASKAKAGTAISVAKVGNAIKYGTADVGTEVTGLAKRAAQATTVGNANVASAPTTVGNADVGDAVVYGKANVGTTVTVQDGKADVGSPVVYGKANVGNAISVALQDTVQTTVGNADVGDEVTYGTADAGSPITFTVGHADVGTAVTVATRAAQATTVGNANVASAPTTVVTGLGAISKPDITVSTTKATYNAEVNEESETLVLSPVTVTAALKNAPTVTPSTTSIYGAVASETSIYGVGSTTSITPAKSATRTQTITPAVASTKTLTPAVAVSATSTKIYGVSGSTSITPAVAAPSTQTLTPAVASNRTKNIAPAVAAPSTQTLTPAKTATTTIYGAVESDNSIYGVTEEQVSVLPAKAAPSTQTLTPAVANGTITPYAFTDVTVPVAATSATIVATGSVSVGGEGDAVMTGLGTPTEEDVLTGVTIVSGTTGDVSVVSEVTQTKNAATDFTGTTDSHTCPAHSHQLSTK